MMRNYEGVPGSDAHRGAPGLPGAWNLILLGPPGSGKGTQGERLQEDFRLPYFATGDILRAAVRDGTDIGKQAKEYMDRGDLSRRGDHRRYRRAASGGTRPPTDSSSTASPHRPPGGGAGCADEGASSRDDRRSPDRSVRGRGGPASGRPTHLRGRRTRLPRRVRPQGGGRLRHRRQQADRPRRRQARGDQAPARAIPRRRSP